MVEGTDPAVAVLNSDLKDDDGRLARRATTMTMAAAMMAGLWRGSSTPSPLQDLAARAVDPTAELGINPAVG